MVLTPRLLEVREDLWREEGEVKQCLKTKKLVTYSVICCLGFCYQILPILLPFHPSLVFLLL